MSIHCIRATTCLRCFTYIHKGLWLIFLVQNLHSTRIKTLERKDKVKRVEQGMYVKPIFSHASLKHVKPFVLPSLYLDDRLPLCSLRVSLSPFVDVNFLTLMLGSYSCLLGAVAFPWCSCSSLLKKPVLISNEGHGKTIDYLHQVKLFSLNLSRPTIQ